MNAKQKAVLIIWALVTASLGVMTAIKIQEDGFNAYTWGPGTVLFISSTLVAGAIWLVCAPKKTT